MLVFSGNSQMFLFRLPVAGFSVSLLLVIQPESSLLVARSGDVDDTIDYIVLMTLEKFSFVRT